MTARYQRGNITLKQRKRGPDAWEFRWYDETGRLRSKLLGTVLELPKRADAERKADALRLMINSELPKAAPIAVSTLIDRYLDDEIEMNRLAFSTQKSYRTYLNKWVRQKWGQHTLQQIRPMAVEQWLRDLDLASNSKLHIRNIMHVVFECAARWELIENNPVTLVRQGGERQADPDVLTAEEFRALLAELTTEPYRTMVILAGCLGLSRSEFSGLQWHDINWLDAVLTVQRGIVDGHVGEPKTKARQKPIPLAPELLNLLMSRRQRSAYQQESDWVFASPHKKGREPYWPDRALENHVQPAAQRAGITKRVGWHCLRHTYSTLLRANGTDIKVQSELLRHSTVAMTLDVYTQAVSDQKRAAHQHVVGQLLAV